MHLKNIVKGLGSLALGTFLSLPGTVSAVGGDTDNLDDLLMTPHSNKVQAIKAERKNKIRIEKQRQKYEKKRVRKRVAFEQRRYKGKFFMH